jgi:hypothetical protein
MSKKQKLELSWFEVESRHGLAPYVRVEFTEDPQQEDSPVRSFEANLAVCKLPRCECLNLFFEWLPAPENPAPPPAPPVQDFWFSLHKNSILFTPELENDPDSQKLGKIIQTELSGPERRQLRAWFLASKLAIIESIPTEEIDISDLPDAEEGEMIGFTEVFPCGLSLNFTLNDESWAVNEQYCVQPRCTCRETALSFLKLEDASGQKATVLRDFPTLRYDYGSAKFKTMASGSPGSPSPHQLMAALKLAHPGLNSELQLHHLIMQFLYLRRYEERSQSRLQSLKTSDPLQNPRVGRNAPCPCGSGRKYKQCCLNKTLP